MMAIKIIHACLELFITRKNVFSPAIDEFLHLQLSVDNKNLSFHLLTNMTHSIKYVKRRTTERSSLNGFERAVEKKKKGSHSPDDGHFHYCCAVFTNNKFQTLNMSWCVRLSILSVLFLLVHSIALHFSGQRSLISLVNLLCPLLVLKFIIFHSPCLCRILFGRKHVFFSFCCLILYFFFVSSAASPG